MQADGRGERCERIVVAEHGVSFLAFWPWHRDLRQGITLRYLHGGPRRPFDLRNRPDSGSREALKNRELFSGAIGQTDVIVEMEQMHGNVVKSVSVPVPHPNRTGAEWLRTEGCDGVITSKPHVLLTARVADCVPIFLHDSTRGVIGLFHAGWRGTAIGILRVGIHRMQEEFGSSPLDITLYLGPSIEKACYPVNRDIYRQFARWMERDPLPEDDLRLDLGKIIRRQALEIGVPEDRIYASGYCTRCSTDLFYSHRASDGHCGRMLAFLGFRK